MKEFTMECSCGDKMPVQASNREEAVAKLKEMMTEDAIKAHMTEKHAGDPLPTIAEVHAMIEKGVTEVE
jgi:hypothetical protein